MLTDNDIKQFQDLYTKRFGAPLDDMTARRKLEALIRQTELVYKPVTVDQSNEYVNEDEISNENQSKTVTF